MDALTTVPAPANEPNLHYSAGNPETAELTAKLAELQSSTVDLTATIDGEQRWGQGEPVEVVQPHKHNHVLGVTRGASGSDAKAAIEAATAAAPQWRAMSFDDRASILLRAADLLAGPWRQQTEPVQDV